MTLSACRADDESCVAYSRISRDVVVFVAPDISPGSIHFLAFVGSYEFLSMPNWELDAINFVTWVRADCDLDGEYNLKWEKNNCLLKTVQLE